MACEGNRAHPFQLAVTGTPALTTLWEVAQEALRPPEPDINP